MSLPLARLETVMELTWESCWDCPIRLSTLALLFAVLIAIGAAGAALTRRNGSLARSFGFVLTAVALLFAALFTRAIARWGIAQWTRGAVWAVLLGLDVVLVGAIVMVHRLRTTRSSPSR
jgi:hypothetical protein